MVFCGLCEGITIGKTSIEKLLNVIGKELYITKQMRKYLSFVHNSYIICLLGNHLKKRTLKL